MRSGAVDAVRVIGIVAIVIGHSWNNELTRTWLFSWHVPVFFFLTGYLWKNGRSVQDEAGKRVRTLIVPYASWLCIIGIFYVCKLIYDGRFKADILYNLLWGGQYIGRPFSAFWFVTALFVVVLVMRIFENFPRWVGPVVAVYALVASYNLGDVMAGVPLSVAAAFPALLFAYAGKLARSYEPSVGKRGLIGLVLLSGGLAMAGSGISLPLDIKQGEFGTPVLSVLVAIAISAGLVWFVQWLMVAAPQSVHKIATLLAQVGFMVVLTHTFPHWIMAVDSNGRWVAFLIGLFLPWTAALVIRRTPLAPLLLGISPASKRSLNRGRGLSQVGSS